MFLFFIIEWIQKERAFSADLTFYEAPPEEGIFVPFLIRQQEASEICEIGFIILLPLLGIKQVLP